MSYKYNQVGQAILSGITGVSPTRIMTDFEATADIVVLQGTATGTPIIQVPDGVHRWIINNQMAVAVTVKTDSGTGATVPAAPNGNKLVWIDSVNANIVA